MTSKKNGRCQIFNIFEEYGYHLIDIQKTDKYRFKIVLDNGSSLGHFEIPIEPFKGEQADTILWFKEQVPKLYPELFKGST